MALPKSALRTLFAALAGVPVSNVLWAGEPVPFVAPKAGQVQGLLTLNLITSKSVGWDDMRKSVNGSSLDTSQEGNRIHSISCRFDAYGSEESFDLLERLRSRLQWDSTRATLRASRLSVVDYTTITTLNGSVDNRELSIAQFDVRLLQTISDNPTQAGDNWIEHASGTGTTTPGGSTPFSSG
jgi:hypothetical protein